MSVHSIDQQKRDLFPKECILYESNYNVSWLTNNPSLLRAELRLRQSMNAHCQKESCYMY